MQDTANTSVPDTPVRGLPVVGVPARVRARGGRAIRPFPMQKLVGDISLVNLRAQTLNEEMLRLAASSPWETIPWQQSLGVLMDVLEGIEEACLQARATCAGLFESAEEDLIAAQRAALVLLERDLTTP
jgi:hypothetical protein